MRLYNSALRETLRAMGLIVISSFIGPYAYAAPADYDGTWRLDGGCMADPSRNQPSFQYHWTTTIENGSFSRTNTFKQPSGQTDTNRWTATIQGSNITIDVDGYDDRGHRWLRKYTGNAISATEIKISGDYFLPSSPGGWQKIARTCTGIFTLISPNSNSLAAKEQQRIDAQRHAEAAQKAEAQRQLAQRKAVDAARQKKLAEDADGERRLARTSRFRNRNSLIAHGS